MQSQFTFVTTEWASPTHKPVEEIVYDPVHSRVATAAFSACVTLWNLKNDGQMHSL